MRVLVTGASGGVGSAIVRRLEEEARWAPVALDRTAPRHGLNGVVRSGTVLADIRDEAIDDVVSGAIDAVVHCAARIPGPDAGEDVCAADNRRIDERVLQFCEARKIPAILFSTAAVYLRRADGAWVDERSPVEPTGLYAAAKLESEQRFLNLAAPGAAVFRITSPYGPEQHTENVIRRFCRAVANGQRLDVWGSGSREQDFVHVEDVARAVVAALRVERFPAGLYLVAAGRPTTMIDLARATLRAAGVAEQPAVGAQPDPEDGRTARYDISRARTHLGWAPQISLAEGIASCLRAWHGHE